MNKAIIILSMILCMPAFVCCEKDRIEKVDDVCTKMEDINFKQYCYDNFDVNKDGKVSMDEANTVYQMDVQKRNIYSLKGIEYFSQLKVLECSDNQLSSLDVSKNAQLTELRCLENKLKSLDVSNNAKLTKLSFIGNELTSLDVSKNKQLTGLYFEGNYLTSIDLSNNTKLVQLNCYGNSLKTIDISCLPLLDRTAILDGAYRYGLQREAGKNITITVYDKEEYWVGIGAPPKSLDVIWVLQ